MITQQDLQAAIAECQGVRNPNANTAIKLAAYLTIQRELFGEPEKPIPAYSFSSAPTEQVESIISYSSDTDFSKAIDGRDASGVWSVMDELMAVLQATNPRLYNAVLFKIKE